MKETKQDRAAALHKMGVSYQDIATMLGISEKHARAAVWTTENRERKAALQKAYGELRYGTPEYRKYNRDYCRERYAGDPAFRQARKDAVARYRARHANDPAFRQANVVSQQRYRAKQRQDSDARS